MAQVRQKLPRVKKKILRVGSGSPKNCLGRVGLVKTPSGQVLTRPIPSLFTLLFLKDEPPTQPLYDLGVLKVVHFLKVFTLMLFTEFRGEN